MSLKCKVKMIHLPDLVASTIPMDTSIIFESEIKNNTTDGCACQKCNEFFPYAETPFNEEFICYSCRLIW